MKKQLIIELDDNEHADFKNAVKSHNSKPMATKLTMRSVLREAIIKFIKKNN